MKYGYFDENKKEYVITRPDTPAPWVNYLGSPEYGAIVSNNAGGYSFAKSGANGRILRYVFNQFDEPGRYIYIRDNKSGDFWSASWQPVGKDLSEYKSECHHGTAYTKMMADYSGIHSEVRYYVPLNKSYEVWNLALTNNSDKTRSINVTGYAEFTNNSNYEQDQVNLQYSQFITRSEFHENRVRQMIHANLDKIENGREVDNKIVVNRFFGLAGAEVQSWCGDKEEFLGRYHGYGNPAGVINGSLNNEGNYNENGCGALTTELSLAPGETKEIAFLVGMKDDHEAAEIIASYADTKAVCQTELEELINYWHKQLAHFQVKTPSDEFNTMINTWNAYNCFMTFIWSRAAWEKGESVAFTCAYAGNLKDIARCLRDLELVSGISRIEIAKEMEYLLVGNEELYENPQKKQDLLKAYTECCAHNLTGHMVVLRLNQIADNLDEKADWLMKHIRTQEWVDAGNGLGWFDGYYDNHGNAVEYCKEGDVRMMLTGQVFAIMSGTAEPEQIQAITKSADRYLFDEKAGGYRLNTNFKEEKFDLGRMFGFAYGEKENGAVFSHMAVMYGNALYKQGFVKEGHQVLKTLLHAAMHVENSVMYPGLPEYFDNDGRGLYAYLTGAASWYMLTMITSVYGVKGELGDLVIAPSLMPEQFDEAGNAALHLEFAGKKFDIFFHNPKKALPEDRKIERAECDGVKLEQDGDQAVRLRRKAIDSLSAKGRHTIEVVLSTT